MGKVANRLLFYAFICETNTRKRSERIEQRTRVAQVQLNFNNELVFGSFLRADINKRTEIPRKHMKLKVGDFFVKTKVLNI